MFLGVWHICLVPHNFGFCHTVGWPILMLLTKLHMVKKSASVFITDQRKEYLMQGYEKN